MSEGQIAYSPEQLLAMDTSGFVLLKPFPGPPVSPSPTPTVTPSSVTPTPTPSISVSPSVTPSVTPSEVPVTPSVTPTITPSISVSVTPTITPTVTPTITPSSSTPAGNPEFTLNPDSADDPPSAACAIGSGPGDISLYMQAPNTAPLADEYLYTDEPCTTPWTGSYGAFAYFWITDGIDEWAVDVEAELDPSPGKIISVTVCVPPNTSYTIYYDSPGVDVAGACAAVSGPGDITVYVKQPNTEPTALDYLYTDLACTTKWTGSGSSLQYFKIVKGAYESAVQVDDALDPDPGIVNTVTICAAPTPTPSPTLTPTPTPTPSPTPSGFVPLTETGILLVAGGGGGGDSYGVADYGGGGGGGGYVFVSGTTLTPGTYPVIVGAGGPANGYGENTTFSGLTANGGGRGGPLETNGGHGGCGGGGGSTTGENNRIGGTGSQGYNGGTTYWGAYYSAGGGGIGSAGQQNIDPGGGAGGAGLAFFGTTYAAGGHGSQGPAGAANTGNGGGGAPSNDGGQPGGSGIVVIRYTGSPQATGGFITESGGYTTHTFTENGVFTYGYSSTWNDAIGYYNMNEVSGSTVGDSIGSNDLTNSGVDIVPGENETGFLFTGTTGVYSDTSIFDFDSDEPFSYNVWIKNYGFTNFEGTVIKKMDGSGKGYAIQVYETGTEIEVQLWNTYGIDGIYNRYLYNWSTGTSEYHMLTVTYDGSTNNTGVKVYVDNVEIPLNSGIGTGIGSITNTGNFKIGQRGDQTYQSLVGAEDELGVWNKVLTSTDRSFLWNLGQGQFYD